MHTVTLRCSAFRRCVWTTVLQFPNKGDHRGFFFFPETHTNSKSHHFTTWDCISTILFARLHILVFEGNGGLMSRVVQLESYLWDLANFVINPGNFYLNSSILRGYSSSAPRNPCQEIPERGSFQFPTHTMLESCYSTGCKVKHTEEQLTPTSTSGQVRTGKLKNSHL